MAFSGLHCPYADDMTIHRCNPSAEVLQRIYTFSSSMASDFVGQRTFIGNATCSAGAFIRADACLPAQWRRRSYTREVRVSTACPGRSWALLLLNHCPGVALNHILEPLLPRRQHVRRLQEVAGVLMHSKSRSDPSQQSAALR